MIVNVNINGNDVLLDEKSIIYCVNAILSRGEQKIHLVPCANGLQVGNAENT